MGIQCISLCIHSVDFVHSVSSSFFVLSVVRVFCAFEHYVQCIGFVVQTCYVVSGFVLVTIWPLP